VSGIVVGDMAEAIDVVARHIVAQEWDSAPDDLVLDYLEVNDEDARTIVGRAYSIVHDPKPSRAEYEAAIALLEARFDENDDE
jgi:hypothetical protein